MRLIVRSSVARTLLAAIGGGGVGAGIYLVGVIEGLPRFLLVGVVTGLGVAALIQLYVRPISLTEVKVNVPQVSQLTFVVNNDTEKTAWELFIEVATRVSTQPLGSQEGFLREALNSLYSLFGRARDLLAQSQPSKVAGPNTVEHLALTMLNRELRPFLSKWHPLLARFERVSGSDEASWEHHTTLRSELEDLRTRLVEFALSFAHLSGVPDPESLLQVEPADADEGASAGSRRPGSFTGRERQL